MRSARLLVSISALALGAAGCSSSPSPPAGETVADSGGADDGRTPVEAGSGSDSSTPDGSTGTDGAATIDAGDLAPPDLSNVCPDNNPTNLTFATAQTLPLDSLGRAIVGAGVIESSPDWFSFVAPKHDPALITTTYTVGAGNTSQLRLDDYDTTDSYVTNDTSTRTLSKQTLSTVFEANAGGTYYSRVESDSATCTGFYLYVKSLYCTDQYEDNDSTSQTAPITLTSTAYVAPTTWATSTATIDANIDGLDDDWYAVTAPLSDPMTASVTYTRPAGDTVTLRLDVHDNTDSYVTNDTSTRTMASQTLNTEWEATAGTTYRIRVQSNTQGVCADYSATFDGLACTDNFEDNDTFATAKAIPATATPTTVSQLDVDYYRITGPSANGSCTVSYTVPAGSTQQLRVDVYDIGDNYINNDTTTRTGNSQTLTVPWTSSESPYAVRVEASQPECTPYTITCH